TPETRLAILRLKTALMNHPAYRRRFFSTDLYHAVLDEGVRTLEAFQTYLREIGLELELV
ncbi:MAG: hypothetical protein JW750_06240, partial [Anaerolineaceae bacterium]|nr:hypothetical protein [Anaerolineaceae bacterium]